MGSSPSTTYNVILFPGTPAANATVVLFDSTVLFQGTNLRSSRVENITFNFVNISHPSAPGGFGVEASIDGLVWDVVDFGSTMPATVTVSNIGSDNRIAFDVRDYIHLRFTYTNGTTQPTIWRGYIILTLG